MWENSDCKESNGLVDPLKIIKLPPRSPPISVKMQTLGIVEKKKKSQYFLSAL